MSQTKNPVGRPKIEDSNKQIYGRPPMYPETYKKVKALSSEDGKKIVDWLDDVITEHVANRHKS